MRDPFGEPAPSFDDPLGMLSACHGRIERQLATLERLARHLPEHGADMQARNAARGILRYFDSAEPNHHADEESSVFPRLLSHSPSARELVHDLQAQHEQLRANWRRLRPLLAGIACGQRANLPPGLVREVLEAYDRHLSIEDERLLPLCKDLLTRDDVQAIGREMAARRGSAIELS